MCTKRFSASFSSIPVLRRGQRVDETQHECAESHVFDSSQATSKHVPITNEVFFCLVTIRLQVWSFF